MISRRNMLMALVSVAASSALPASATGPSSTLSDRKPASGKPGKGLPWRNWSGSQTCFPQVRKAPATLGELQELITSSKGVIRPVGAGHSFSALVPTDDTIISLSRLSGLVDHQRDSLQATFHGGTRLGSMGQPLENIGQALINMPDIDEQSLAGCLATATHGTGAGIGCIPTFVIALQMVTAKGDIIHCSLEKNRDIFEAARVSLGALGFVTQVTLKNVEPYRLKRETTWHAFEEILEQAESMADQNRNFEFYYVPFTGMGWMDIHNITSEPLGSSDKLDTNDSAEQLKMARDVLSWSPRLRELVLGSYMKTIPREVTVESSWKNYANERNVRFNEMEYHLPREHGLKAMKEIRATLEKHHSEVFFPIEFRYVKGDDIWLSPFYQRDTCSIAIHRFFEEDFTPYFKAIEPILRKYHGRPHWGKLNTLTASDFARLYPRWNDFSRVRSELDPDGKFLNPYLSKLFG